MQKRPLVLLTLLILSTYGFSQTRQDSIVDQEVKVNTQLWMDYNFTKIYNENKNLSTQIGFRTISPSVYNRYLGISTLNFRNTKNILKIGPEPLFNSYHLGAGVIYTENFDSNDNLELRFIQGVKFEIPTIKLITFYNYVRFEQRFQNAFNKSGFIGGFRFRYRLSTILSWNKHLLSFTEGLYFPLETEFFFNLKRTDRFNDLIRISPGIGYRFKSDWRCELYVIYNRTKNITQTNNRSNDFILRLRVFKGNSNKKELHINDEDGFD